MKYYSHGRQWMPTIKGNTKRRCHVEQVKYLYQLRRHVTCRGNVYVNLKIFLTVLSRTKLLDLLSTTGVLCVDLPLGSGQHLLASQVELSFAGPLGQASTQSS